MKTNKSEPEYTSDLPDAVNSDIHDETLEGTEIDPCEASSSSRPLGMSYFHVGDGLFSKSSSYDLSEILDITHLDLSDRPRRRT